MLISDRIDKTYYTFGDSGVKIVFLQDIHDKTFGKDNKDFIGAVKSEEPDLILIGGDTVNGWQQSIETSKCILNQLQNIAECYTIIGNHEKATIKNLGIQYEDIFSSAGVKILNNSFETINIKGVDILLAGMTPWQFRNNELDKDEEKFLQYYEEYVNSNKSDIDYKIFMQHQPLLFMKELKNIESDLVLCGHIHGGQIQIPLLGGLYHPDLGFFSKYAQGLHNLENGKILIQRGIGNNVAIPRINNRPEIIVISI